MNVRNLIKKIAIPIALSALIVSTSSLVWRTLHSKPVKPLSIEPASRVVTAEKNKQPITTTYRVRNLGNRSIKLGDPRTSCGCSVAKIDPNVVDPGGSIDIHVTGDPPTTGSKRVLIKVPTDSKELPEISCELVMVGQGDTPYVSYDSKAVPFGSITMNQLPFTQDIMIMTRETSSRKPWINRVESTIEGVSIKGGLAEETDRGDYVVQRVYRFKATLEKAAPGTILNGLIKAYGVDDTNTPIVELPVSGSIENVITADPPALYWNLLPGEKAKPARVQITSNEKRFDPLKVDAESIPARMSVRRVETKGDSAEFEIEWDSTDSAELTAEIVFRTGFSANPKIKIPVSIRRSPVTIGIE
jgi:hypothetical protein